MEVSINKQDGLDALLSVKINPEDYREEYNKLLSNYRKNMNMPGFRKGKVPAGLVQKMVGKDAKREVVEQTLHKGINEYVKEKDLKMVLNPLAEYEQEEVNWQNDDFEFLYSVGLRPEVKIDLKSLNKLERPKVEISEEELTEEIESLRKRQADVVELDSLEADENARVVLHFTELNEEGEPLEEGFDKRVLFPAGKIPAGVKKYVAGKEKGHEENVKIADILTADEMAEFFALQEPAVKDLNPEFKLKVVAYNKEELPEMNQDFFDKILGEGKVSSEEEFRAEWKQQIESYFNEQGLNLLAHDIKKKLMEETALEMPEQFLSKYLLMHYEVKSKDEIEDFEEKEKDFREQMQWIAISDSIVDEQNIEVTREDLINYTADYLGQSFMQMGYPSLGRDFLLKYAEDYLKKEENVSRMHLSARDGKVFDYLLSVVEPQERTVSRDEFLEMGKNQ